MKWIIQIASAVTGVCEMHEKDACIQFERPTIPLHRKSAFSEVNRDNQTGQLG